MTDTISNLTEDLLLHILSSKSHQTKHVVAATTLLSKRWRSLWTSIPKLEFRDTSFNSYESFLHFVDGTLNLVDLKSLKIFVLKCERFDDESYVEVESWVNKVLMLKSELEYLNLWFPLGFYFLIRVPLPSSVFNCSSIRILKLTRVNVSNVSTVNLPSLKTLHLRHVEFPNPQSLSMLLSKCVRLEEMLLLYVELPDDYENTKLDIGRFHHLAIALVPVALFTIKTFANVTCLSLNERISFPIQYDLFHGDYDTFYNLSHLEIDYLTQKGWTNMLSCLLSFPKLETLIIYKGLKGFDYWSMGTSVDVPPWISSHLKTFALFGFHNLKSEFEIVRFIMKYAKVLRSLMISTRKYPSQDESDRLELLEILSSYPKCSENCSVFVDVPAGSVFENVYSKLASEKEFSYFVKA